MWLGHESKGGRKFGGLAVRGKHWLLFSLQTSEVCTQGSGVRAPFLVIIGDLWGKACAVAGMKAGDSLGDMFKSASIFVREMAWERKQGGSRERLALNEQDSEGKWAGSM